MTMKRVMAAAFALSLLGGASALAQEQHDDHGAGGPAHGGGGAPHGAAGGAPHGAPGGGADAGAPHGAPGGGAGAPHVIAPVVPAGGGGAPHGAGAHGGVVNPGAGFGAGGVTYQQPSSQSGGQPGGGHNGPSGLGNGGGSRPGPGGANNGGQRAGPNNNNFRPNFGAPGARPGGPRPQYNPQFFPHSIRPTQRFQWRGTWNAPNGYYQRHWRYGDRLPWGWYTQSYWIDDYDYYDLAVPPFGYEWVRLGPDALLVDTSDGEVVEVARGIFY